MVVGDRGQRSAGAVGLAGRRHQRGNHVDDARLQRDRRRQRTVEPATVGHRSPQHRCSPEQCSVALTPQPGRRVGGVVEHAICVAIEDAQRGHRGRGIDGERRTHRVVAELGGEPAVRDDRRVAATSSAGGHRERRGRCRRMEHSVEGGRGDGVRTGGQRPGAVAERGGRGAQPGGSRQEVGRGGTECAVDLYILSRGVGHSYGDRLDHHVVGSSPGDHGRLAEGHRRGRASERDRRGARATADLQVGHAVADRDRLRGRVGEHRSGEVCPAGEVVVGVGRDRAAGAIGFAGRRHQRCNHVDNTRLQGGRGRQRAIEPAAIRWSGLRYRRRAEQRLIALAP